jgi:hypothetical protein
MKNLVKITVVGISLVFLMPTAKVFASSRDIFATNQRSFIGQRNSLPEKLIAVSKADSPIWQSFQAWRGGTKTNGLSGSKRRYYEWDNTHEDIEVYDSNGNHLGSMDATSGAMIKPAVSGRKITL